MLQSPATDASGKALSLLGIISKIPLIIKMAVVLVVFAIGFLSIIGVSLYTFQQLERDAKRLAEVNEQGRDLASFKLSTVETIGALDLYLLTNDAGQIPVLSAALDRSLRHFTDFVSKTIALDDEGGTSLFINNERYLLQFRLFVQNALETAQRGDRTAAIALRESALARNFLQVQRLVDSAEQQRQDMLVDIAAQSEARIADIIRLAILASFTILVAAILFVAVIGRSVINSEKALKRANLELAENQAKLLEAERFSTLGLLMAKVSHEIRNPLASIRATHYLIGQLADKHGLDLVSPLKRAERAISRCDNIIGDLLEYTRRKDVKPESIDLSAYLAELLDKQKVPENVSLRRALPEPGPLVEIDAGRFARAITNLLQNAYQAIQESDLMSGEVEVSVSENLDQVFIAVEDSGGGMTDEVFNQIFEPLFTTRSFGAGMGLPTVLQLVEQHKGRIGVDSDFGTGTTVTLALPKPQATAADLNQKNAEAA